MRPGADGIFGNGITAELDAELHASRVLVERAVGGAIVSHGAGAYLSLDQALIRDTVKPRTTYGSGLYADEGTIDATRTELVRNRYPSILGRAGATVALADCVVRDTLEAGHADFNRSTLRATRVLFERGVGTALSATATGGHLILEDVVVRDTAATSEGWWGRAIGVQYNAGLDATRLLVDHNGEIAVAMFDSIAPILTDVVVRDTAISHPGGGIGILVQDHVNATFSRVEVVQSHLWGVLANNAMLHATDLTVRDTQRLECPTCGDRHFAAGLGVLDATVDATGFRFANDSVCGVVLFPGAEVDLGHGEVSGNEIGACVQVDGYDFARLSSDVVYRANMSNLSATTLPVPDPLPYSPDLGI
jgi:hypothetical protein